MFDIKYKISELRADFNIIVLSRRNGIEGMDHVKRL